MSIKTFSYKALSVLVGVALLINTTVYAMPANKSTLRAPSAAVATVSTGGEQVKAGSAGKIKLAAVLAVALAGALALSSVDNIAAPENDARIEMFATDVVVSNLIGHLEDEDSKLHLESIVALGEIGPAANAAVPALIRELEKEYCFFRFEIIIALGEIGPAANAAVPTLITHLGDKNIYAIKGAAAWALGEIGPAANAAVPALKRELGDKYSDFRESVAEALKKIQQDINTKQQTPKTKPGIGIQDGSMIIPSTNPLHTKSSSAGTLNLDNVSTLTDNNLTRDINIANQQGNLNFANILLESLLSSKLIDMNPMLAGEYAKLEKDAIVGIDDAMLPENHLFKTYLKIGTEQLKALEEVYGCTIRLLSQLTADEIAGKKLIIMSDRTEIKGYEKALYMHLSKQKVESGLLLSPYIGIAKLLLVAREDMVADIVNALNKDGLYSMLFGRPANINEITAFLISGIYELPTPTILNYQAAEERHRASLAALIAA